VRDSSGVYLPYGMTVLSRRGARIDQIPTFCDPLAGALRRQRRVALRIAYHSGRNGKEDGHMSITIHSLSSPAERSGRAVETQEFTGPVSNQTRDYHLLGHEPTPGHTGVEAIIHNAVVTLAASLDDKVDSRETGRHLNDEAGEAHRDATARSNSVGAGRHVYACDLHPGDVVQQYDWSLHIREVKVSQAGVAVGVTEFGFPLHYGADEQVRLAD
jgi:hypothetical protein